MTLHIITPEQASRQYDGTNSERIYEPDDLAPAKGIGLALLLSIPLWLLVGAAVFQWLSQ